MFMRQNARRGQKKQVNDSIMQEMPGKENGLICREWSGLLSPITKIMFTQDVEGSRDRKWEVNV